MRPTIPNLPGGLPIGLFAGGAVLAAGFAAAALPNLIRMPPQVGDIVVFSPAAPATPRDQPATRIVVRRPGTTGCVLDLGVIGQTGGSLIIEAQFGRPLPGFRLHWAGQRTSDGSDDCGSNADMIVGDADLTNLVVSAEATLQPRSIIAHLD